MAEVPFVLDGRPSDAHEGEMLISAAERAGVFIPRFCYHPRMKSVGNCRMCLVEVIGPRGATLTPSCFVPVTEGMEVVTTSPGVKKAQEGVLELLLANHPLDCPVCDKGGECPLQDQTVSYGPGESRFVEEKRHFEKPIAISDLVLLDRERCIQCSRCTRFAEEIAGEALIDFAGRGEMVEVATFPDRPFTSYFSGNTVQICPVGALTATPYRFSARPWDLDQVESTCSTCALGCRVAVQSSANRLTRLLGIDSDPVNQGWLCDKGRFVFESVNGDTEEGRVPAAVRIADPLVRIDGELVSVGWSEALAAASKGLGEAIEAGGPEAVAFLGGSRMSNEGAYAWAKVAKGVIGTDSVDVQLGDGLPADLVLSLPRATIDEACQAKVVLLLTGDVREELPVLFLRLRQAVLEGGSKLVELGPRSTSLTPYATAFLSARPGDIPVLARALTGDSSGLATALSHPEGPACSEEQLELARSLIAGTANPGSSVGQGGSSAGEGLVVLFGRASLSESDALTAEALSVIAGALPGARFLPTLRRGNVQGALDMGMAPGLLPGRVSLDGAREWFTQEWGSVPAASGRDATGILRSLSGEVDGESDRSRVKALVLLGVDLLSDFPDARLAEKAFANADFVVVVGGHHSSTVDRADVVLPAAVTHERPGTFTNIEGRVSRLGQKLVAPAMAWPDWTIAAELASGMGKDLGFETLGDIWDEIEHLAPAYKGVTRELLDSHHARDGILVPLRSASAGAEPVLVSSIDPIAIPGVDSVERQGAPPRVGLTELDGSYDSSTGDESPAVDAPVGPINSPRVLSRAIDGAPGVHVPSPDSYSLRLVSTRRLYDRGSASAGSPSLVPLIPEARVRANPYDLARLGVQTGDPVRVRSKNDAVVLEAAADGGVPRGVVVVEFNLSEAHPPLGPSGSPRPNVAASLIDVTETVNDVRLESVR